MATVTYIDGGTAQNTTKVRFIGPGNTSQAGSDRYNKLKTTGNNSSTFTFGVQSDLPLGGDVIQDRADLRTLRNPNEPSGYTVNGTPTFGDGKQNTTTDMGADYSHNSNEKFGYLMPTGPRSKKFSDL